MLNLKDIRFLTPEERAEAAARRRDEETQVYQKRLASLDEWPLDRPCGRSRLVLPPEVAQRVLDDVAAGASLRAIEDKYRALGYPFSRRWLKDSLNDGRLRQMALGEKHGRKHHNQRRSLQILRPRWSLQPIHTYIHRHHLDGVMTAGPTTTLTR